MKKLYLYLIKNTKKINFICLVGKTLITESVPRITLPALLANPSKFNTLFKFIFPHLITLIIHQKYNLVFLFLNDDEEFVFF